MTEGAARSGRTACSTTPTPMTSTARGSSTWSSTPTIPASPSRTSAPRSAGDGFGYTGISPADLIATFGTPGSKYYAARSGPAGFTDAIAGWDFVDDTNDPYDAVHYDHGTGTAEDAAERPAPWTRRWAPVPTAW